MKSLIRKENPLNQRFISSKLEMFPGTVNKFIHKDLQLKKMFKPTVHMLFTNLIAEKTVCTTLNKIHLAAEK